MIRVGNAVHPIQFQLRRSFAEKRKRRRIPGSGERLATRRPAASVSGPLQQRGFAFATHVICTACEAVEALQKEEARIAKRSESSGLRTKRPRPESFLRRSWTRPSDDWRH